MAIIGECTPKELQCDSFLCAPAIRVTVRLEPSPMVATHAANALFRPVGIVLAVFNRTWFEFVSHSGAPSLVSVRAEEVLPAPNQPA